MAKQRRAPWERPNPKRKSTRLSAKSKSSAKARAKRAGRTYPNLIDNMRAAANQKRGGTGAKKRAKKRATTRRRSRR
jgi:hypothetical protein